MTLDALTPAAVAMLARMLLGSRWSAPRCWPLVVVELTPEAKRVVLRVELAELFRRNGLPQLAHDVLARRIAAGEVLVHIQRDDAEGAGVGLAVVNLRAELARVAGGG